MIKKETANLQAICLLTGSQCSDLSISRASARPPRRHTTLGCSVHVVVWFNVVAGNHIVQRYSSLTERRCCRQRYVGQQFSHVAQSMYMRVTRLGNRRLPPACRSADNYRWWRRATWFVTQPADGCRQRRRWLRLQRTSAEQKCPVSRRRTCQRSTADDFPETTVWRRRNSAQVDRVPV